MRFVKTLYEQAIDDLDAQGLLERLAQIERLLQISTDREQKRKLVLLKSRIQERLNNYVPYTSVNWGTKPQNIDHLIELLQNADKEDERALGLAETIVQFRDEYGELTIAQQLLELVQDLDTNEKFANYNNYDYSDITEYLASLIRNEDILLDDPWVATAANDFATGFGATTMFGMVSSVDWGLVSAGFKQIRTAEEFKLVNDYFSGELDEEGRDITELAASKSHRRPADGFDNFYKFIANLGIGHTLPNYWYYRGTFGMDPRSTSDVKYIASYAGLPQQNELEEIGYTFSEDGIALEGNSGMSIDREGKLQYTNTVESIQESKDIEENELTYHGDEFFEDYGVMWFNEDDELDEAEYQGREVKLGKPMQGDVKKFKVYVRNPKGNVVKVNFGDPDMRIRKSDPDARRSFRARHNCDNPGPRHKARYWSCRKW